MGRNKVERTAQLKHYLCLADVDGRARAIRDIRQNAVEQKKFDELVGHGIIRRTTTVPL